MRSAIFSFLAGIPRPGEADFGSLYLSDLSRQADRHVG